MHPRHHDRIQPLHDRVQLSSTERNVIAAMEADLAHEVAAAPAGVGATSWWRGDLPWWLRAALTAVAAVLTTLTVAVSPLFGFGAALPLGVLAVSSWRRWSARDGRPLTSRLAWRRHD